MANAEKFGKITAVSGTEFGANLRITWEDGSLSVLSVTQFSEKYLGHGGTRFVTREAYDTWQKDRIEAYHKAYGFPATRREG